MSDPCSWSCRQLCAAWCGRWELSSDPQEEQSVPLSSEASLQSFESAWPIFVIWVVDFFLT